MYIAFLAHSLINLILVECPCHNMFLLTRIGYKNFDTERKNSADEFTRIFPLLFILYVFAFIYKRS